MLRGDDNNGNPFTSTRFQQMVTTSDYIGYVWVCGTDVRISLDILQHVMDSSLSGHIISCDRIMRTRLSPSVERAREVVGMSTREICIHLR